jgi:hypothetical protein
MLMEAKDAQMEVRTAASAVGGMEVSVRSQAVRLVARCEGMSRRVFLYRMAQGGICSSVAMLESWNSGMTARKTADGLLQDGCGRSLR